MFAWRNKDEWDEAYEELLYEEDLLYAEELEKEQECDEKAQYFDVPRHSI